MVNRSFDKGIGIGESVLSSSVSRDFQFGQGRPRTEPGVRGSACIRTLNGNAQLAVDKWSINRGDRDVAD